MIFFSQQGSRAQLHQSFWNGRIYLVTWLEEIFIGFTQKWQNGACSYQFTASWTREGVNGFSITELRESTSKEAKAEYLYSKLRTFTVKQREKSNVKRRWMWQLLQRWINQHPFVKRDGKSEGYLYDVVSFWRDGRQRWTAYPCGSSAPCTRRGPLWMHRRSFFSFLELSKEESRLASSWWDTQLKNYLASEDTVT